MAGQEAGDQPYEHQQLVGRGRQPPPRRARVRPDDRHPNGPGPAERNLELRRAGVRFIPIYAGIPAGLPTSHDMDVDYEEVLDWGNDFERWGRIINGYSMARMLLPGDIAIFENRRFETGDVVHAYKDGEDCVKAIRGQGEAIALYSFNEDYDPFSAIGWKAKGVLVQRIRRGPYGVKSVVDFPHGLKWAMRNEEF